MFLRLTDSQTPSALRHVLLAIVLIVGCGGLPSRAQEVVDYQRQIKPIFAARCYACHGALKQNAKLRLDTAALAIQGGKHGQAIKPGDPVGSALLTRIIATDELDRMPPEGEPLKPAEIAAIRAWISQGAKGPAGEKPERDPQDHWAFKAPVRPAIPTFASAAWSKNPIDAFIAAEHAQRKLTPVPPTDRRLWLRRVSIDLIGLPPTREEMDTFVADQSDDAYDKVVSRLLGSPQYGERWGRHWMDIWRYSDWWGLGAEVRNSQKHIWHWRDWIVESLNADKPYDQMLREMLAADELYPNDMDRLRAGGFLARQYFKFNRTTWLDGAVEHTAKAMLGLTFNCAKCHDHKYDPISHVDYYQLRAFFEPYQVRTDVVDGELDPEKNGIPRGFDSNLKAETYLHLRGDDRNPDKSRAIAAAMPSFLSRETMQIVPVDLPVEAHQPGLRSFVIDTHLKLAEQRAIQAEQALAQAKKTLIEAERVAILAAQAKAKAELEMPKQAAAQATVDAVKKEAKTLLRDDFAAAKPDVWEMRGGNWAYAKGKLSQSQSGATRTAIRYKHAPPTDFEAKLKYIPTGGDMWKSIGIAFDVTEQGHMVTAYLSAYAGGPKSQITYKNNGADVYPPEAAQGRKVDLNKSYEITLRVRGTLMNVLIDGEQSLAYRLPIERKNGHLEISTFDAMAQLVAFELSELAEDVVLSDAASPTAKAKDGPLSVEEAKLMVALAQKALAVATLQSPSIKARAAAQRAQYQQPVLENLAALVAEAVRSERMAAAAQAEENAARAELELAKAVPAKRADAQKKFDASKVALEKSQQAIAAPGGTFTPLVGSLKMFESNLESEASRRAPFPTTSTGRRTALAAWITDVKNPLTARVAVNHIWSRHMGQPLVATVFDFGRKGALPTHPQLLDWLAVELIEQGWNMKHLHRLIVTSQTYRLSSSNLDAAPATRQADPDNHYYWRANPGRMEAQVVRDSLLLLAGELDLTQGGPSIPASSETSRRRSIYFVHSHNEHQKFLSMFDDANVLDCYRRTQSIVPQQALALANSALATSMAQKIAQRLTAANAALSDSDFSRAAFVTVLCAEPNDTEMHAMIQAMAKLSESARLNKRPDPLLHARTSLVHALLNHNDFITIR